MKLETIVNKFLSNHSYLGMGAGKLSKQWGVDKDLVYEAKDRARKIIAADEKATLSNIISQQEEQIVQYIGSDVSEDSLTKKFESPIPLSPEEIEKLVKVDNISTRITKISDKLMANGKWTYSVDISVNGKDFYNKEELNKKLVELFPKVLPIKKISSTKKSSNRALFICISDDHAGAVNLVAKKWDTEEYKKRLLKISEKVKSLGEKFEELHILSLGDQLNGWNSQTTRGGHEVKSLSNRDQFDMYTEGRVAFYDDLFTSDIAHSIYIHEVENSNHSGKDFSYISNKFLEMYVKQRFPFIKYNSYLAPINHIEYGIHTIGFTHGKDEALMIRNLPLKLDPKTDLYLYQYFEKRGIYPTDRRVTLFKGDLHSYAVEKGKFGRYVNIPSLMGSTDWTMVNFGETEAGALIEIVDKETTDITHLPIWFV